MRKELVYYFLYIFVVSLLFLMIYVSEGSALGLIGLIPMIALLTFRRGYGKKKVSEIFVFSLKDIVRTIGVISLIAAFVFGMRHIEDHSVVRDIFTDPIVLFLLWLFFITFGITAFEETKTEPAGVSNG